MKARVSYLVSCLCSVHKHRRDDGRLASDYGLCALGTGLVMSAICKAFITQNDRVEIDMVKVKINYSI